MRRQTATGLLAAAAAMTTGCAATVDAIERRHGYYTANTPDLDPVDVARFREHQESILQQFIALAGVDPTLLGEARSGTPNRGDDSDSTDDSSEEGEEEDEDEDESEDEDEEGAEEEDEEGAEEEGENNSSAEDTGDSSSDESANGEEEGSDEVEEDEGGPNWRPVIDVGIHYADVRCDRFIDALFWLNRARETTSRQIQYLGGASGAILEILSASRQLLSLAPLGFNLMDQTVNNIGRGLLYELHPTAVRTLVEEQQTAYLTAMERRRFRTRAMALQAIQGYVALCLPATLEAEVNKAVANARFTPVQYEREPEERDAESDEGETAPETDESAMDEAGAPEGEDESGSGDTDEAEDSVEDTQAPPRVEQVAPDG